MIHELALKHIKEISPQEFKTEIMNSSFADKVLSVNYANKSNIFIQLLNQ